MDDKFKFLKEFLGKLEERTTQSLGEITVLINRTENPNSFKRSLEGIEEDLQKVLTSIKDISFEEKNEIQKDKF